MKWGTYKRDFLNNNGQIDPAAAIIVSISPWYGTNVKIQINPVFKPRLWPYMVSTFHLHRTF